MGEGGRGGVLYYPPALIFSGNFDFLPPLEILSPETPLTAGPDVRPGGPCRTYRADPGHTGRARMSARAEPVGHTVRTPDTPCGPGCPPRRTLSNIPCDGPASREAYVQGGFQVSFLGGVKICLREVLYLVEKGGSYIWWKGGVLHLGEILTFPRSQDRLFFPYVRPPGLILGGTRYVCRSSKVFNLIRVDAYTAFYRR